VTFRTGDAAQANSGSIDVMGGKSGLVVKWRYCDFVKFFDERSRGCDVSWW
jgi:hypothetical protein